MTEPIVVAPVEDKATDIKPEVTSSGPAQVADKPAVTEDELPEKYRGKTAKEIAKMHQEAEKALGAHSQELGSSRKEIENWRVLGQLIKSRPDLAKEIEREIEKLEGKPATTETPAVRDDTRIATEQIIIDKFEQQFGLTTLPAEKRALLNKKIGQELSEMLDPSGKKSVSQILNSISLNVLPKFLEKAYKLATGNDREEQIRVETYLTARQNSEASFGGMPSSSARGNAITLTEKQKAAARGLKISEEDYIKQLQELKGD